MAKTGFTEEEHREYGRQLKQIHAQLNTLQVAISNKYGVVDKNVGRVRSALEKLSQVRSGLEEQFIVEHDLDATHPDWNRIYYGPDDAQG